MHPRGAHAATRWTAALLAAVALLPALHHAVGHGAAGSFGELAFAAAPQEAGPPAPEICPVCLAGKSGTALPAIAGADLAIAPATRVRIQVARHSADRIVRGPASPRAPPSA